MAFGRRKRRRPKFEDEEHHVKSRSAPHNGDRFGLTLLQQQVGNQAVQRLVAQQQADENEQGNKAAEVGEVKIEKPEIEYYEVDGNSLPDVASQILPPGEWHQCTYQYKPKIEDGVIVRVDVTVLITLRLPRWVGQGWDQAPDADKFEWLQMLQTMTGEPEEYEDITELPKQWLLGPKWEKSPEEVKKTWRAMLQEFQNHEKSYLDIVRRRVMVLQQRLFNQPENQVKAIFDQFIKDLKIEQEVYNRQKQSIQEQKVSLGADVMIQ